MGNARLLPALGVLLAALAAPEPRAALAYDDDSPHPAPSAPDAVAPAPVEGPRWSLTTYADQDWTVEADLRGGEGSVDRSRTETGFYVSARLSRAWRLGLGARFDYFVYDFDNPTAILGVRDRLMRLAHRVSAGPSITYVFNDRWRLTTRLSVGFARERDARLSDSLTFGATAFVGWQIFENIRLNVGGTARFSRLFIDSDVPSLLPIVGFEWTGAERWGEGRGLKGFGVGIGADGAFVRMNLTDTVAIMASARYESHAFRLNRRNIVPEGIFSEQRVPLGVQLEWSPHPRVVVAAHVDAIVWHRYDVSDEEGDRGSHATADPTVAAGFGATIYF